MTLNFPWANVQEFGDHGPGSMKKINPVGSFQGLRAAARVLNQIFCYLEHNKLCFKHATRRHVRDGNSDEKRPEVSTTFFVF